MKKLVLSFVVLLGIVVGASCANNPAATAVCAASASADACATCCTANGASGNTYTPGNCDCRGY